MWLILISKDLNTVLVFNTAARGMLLKKIRQTCRSTAETLHWPRVTQRKSLRPHQDPQGPVTRPPSASAILFFPQSWCPSGHQLAFPKHQAGSFLSWESSSPIEHFNHCSSDTAWFFFPKPLALGNVPLTFYFFTLLILYFPSMNSTPSGQGLYPFRALLFYSAQNNSWHTTQ